MRTQTRSILQSPTPDGLQCDVLMRTVPCNVEACRQILTTFQLFRATSVRSFATYSWTQEWQPALSYALTLDSARLEPTAVASGSTIVTFKLYDAVGDDALQRVSSVLALPSMNVLNITSVEWLSAVSTSSTTTATTTQSTSTTSTSTTTSIIASPTVTATDNVTPTSTSTTTMTTLTGTTESMTEQMTIESPTTTKTDTTSMITTSQNCIGEAAMCGGAGCCDELMCFSMVCVRAPTKTTSMTLIPTVPAMMSPSASGGGLLGWHIALIVIGVILLLVAVAVAIFILTRSTAGCGSDY